MSSPVISIQSVSKCYRRADASDLLSERLGRLFSRSARDQKVADEEFHALTDVSFDVEEGEVLGLIGRNGAGKSTLLKIISRIIRPSSGRVVVRGALGSLLEVGTGFHPELTGRENVYLNGSIIGMSKADIARRFDEIVEFAETGAFIDTPLKHYSSGMQTRLAFSIASHVDAQTLILDEVLSVGDFHFQRKCLEKIRELSTGDRTILLVSHNMSTVLDICNKCALLDAGALQACGDPRDVVAAYQSSGGSNLTEFVDPTDQMRMYDLGFVLSDGTPVEVIENGQPASFRLMVEAKQRFERVALHVSIEDESLRRITSLDSRLTNDTWDLEPGVYEFRVELPDVPLARGQYATRLKFNDVNGQVLWVERGPSLYIENGAEFGRRTFHITDWHGPVHLRQQWSVRQASEVWL